MKYKKYQLEETFEESFSLIAIHSSLEDFQLAYFINKNCATYFKRNHDLYSPYLKQCLKGLVWKNDHDKENHWHLFSNKYEGKTEDSKQVSQLFFGEKLELEQFVLPEFKLVNYFIKKPGDISNETFIYKLKEVSEIQIAYSIPEKNIKSYQNIIFE